MTTKRHSLKRSRRASSPRKAAHPRQKRRSTANAYIWEKLTRPAPTLL